MSLPSLGLARGREFSRRCNLSGVGPLLPEQMVRMLSSSSPHVWMSLHRSLPVTAATLRHATPHDTVPETRALADRVLPSLDCSLLETNSQSVDIIDVAILGLRTWSSAQNDIPVIQCTAPDVADRWSGLHLKLTGMGREGDSPSTYFASTFLNR